MLALWLACIVGQHRCAVLRERCGLQNNMKVAEKLLNQIGRRLVTDKLIACVVLLLVGAPSARSRNLLCCRR